MLHLMNWLCGDLKQQKQLTDMRKKNPDITNQNVYMPHLNLIPNRLMPKTNYNNLAASRNSLNITKIQFEHGTLPFKVIYCIILRFFQINTALQYVDTKIVSFLANITS